jgi:hypothetical protein
MVSSMIELSIIVSTKQACRVDLVVAHQQCAKHQAALTFTQQGTSYDASSLH